MRTMAMLAVTALLFCAACSQSKESRREDEGAAATPAEPTTPKTGLLTSVDSQRLMLDSADDPGEEDLLFERTTRSMVIRDGREIGWEELQEGDAVRVFWDRGVFGPDRVAQIEVLSGPEAEKVRQQVEAEMQIDDSNVYDPMEPREIDPGVGVPNDPTLPPQPTAPEEPQPGF